MPRIDPTKIRTRLQLTEALAQLFREGGWSHHRLAEAAGGLSPATVMGIVNGSTEMPRAATLRALATALGQDPDAWLAARGRILAEGESGLPAQIAELLAAQRVAAERMPYRVAGRVPPLSRVYVTQQAVPDGRGDEESELVSLQRVLSDSRHALILGEPGSGKSTLTQHLVHATATWWSRQPGDRRKAPYGAIVPVRIPAPMLVGTTLHRALAAACGVELGLGLDDPPEAELFAAPPFPGGEWLILVDGLDEILSVEVRQAVLRILGGRMAQKGSRHRFLITTRPLADAELDFLAGPDLKGYRLRLFSSGDLDQFATRWFTGLGAADPSADAARFRLSVRHSRLEGIVQVPLVAVIAITVYGQNRGGDLPTSRSDLYATFIEYLLHGRQQRLHTRRELSEHLAVYGTNGERLAIWLFDRRKDLLVALATAWLAGDDRTLPEVALTWIRGECPYSPDVVPDFPEILTYLLISTGLIVHETDQPVFLHRSFAEYLASTEFMITSESFADWVQAALDPIGRNVALFAFHHWVVDMPEKAERHVGALLRGEVPRPDVQMLAPLDDLFFDVSQALLAGDLLAEGIPFRRSLCEAVVARLVGLVLELDEVNAASTLRVLSRIPPRPEVIVGLAEITNAVGVASSLRVDAARTQARHERLGHPKTQTAASIIGTALYLADAEGPSAGVELLIPLIGDQTADLNWRVEAVRALRGFATADIVGKVSSILATGVGIPASVRLLYELGDINAAARLLRSAGPENHTFDLSINVAYGLYRLGRDASAWEIISDLFWSGGADLFIEGVEDWRNNYRIFDIIRNWNPPEKARLGDIRAVLALAKVRKCHFLLESDAAAAVSWRRAVFELINRTSHRVNGEDDIRLDRLVALGRRGTAYVCNVWRANDYEDGALNRKLESAFREISRIPGESISARIALCLSEPGIPRWPCRQRLPSPCGWCGSS